MEAAFPGGTVPDHVPPAGSGCSSSRGASEAGADSELLHWQWVPYPQCGGTPGYAPQYPGGKDGDDFA